jgi:hypothetical protein
VHMPSPSSLPLRVTLPRGVGLTYGGYWGAGSGKAGRYAGGGGDRATLHHHHEHQEEGEEQSRDKAVVGHPSSLSKILYQTFSSFRGLVVSKFCIKLIFGKCCILFYS